MAEDRCPQASLLRKPVRQHLLCRCTKEQAGLHEGSCDCVRGPISLLVAEVTLDRHLHAGRESPGETGDVSASRQQTT